MLLRDRTEQADAFSSRLAPCEPVGLRREESLFVSFFPLIFALVWVFSLHLCLASLFNPTKRGASVESHELHRSSRGTVLVLPSQPSQRGWKHYS